ALVQDLLSIYRGSVKRRQLRLELALPDAPLIARGDKNVLYRVFDNLFSNAAKFSPRGGAIRLELGMDQHSVYLLVADQGPGVAEEHRGKVFEKFGIVELRQQQVVQLGFGLAFCKLAVEAHGGTIEIGGNQPQGATFLVRLPATSVTGKSG
ncbi:MAG TPA: ATP-binding protein, partial [Polyangiaceae bacterium]|nr:ATP-binding protein [Polyangiaceae bacterium]